MTDSIYRAACQGNPGAIVEYLTKADPEDVNHAVLAYIEDIEGDRNFYLTERDRLQAEVDNLRMNAHKGRNDSEKPAKAVPNG